MRAHTACTCPVHQYGYVYAFDYPRVEVSEKLEMFLKKFRTWACLNRCHSALDSETAVNTSGTPRADVGKLHDYNLVENSLKVW